MRYLSLFSGIEAASCAWHPLGWECVGVSEIDPFPRAVLQHHYPSVPNFGDVSNFHEWPDNTDPDLIVGGSPCQAFSVAGLRKGLDDPRGNLTLTYLAVVAKYRPQWVVWENVPGVLSIDQGRVFGAFLGAMGQLGYGWAYRVLDAQFFGVPQRRRRVFVVGYLGDWQRAGAVLFEPHSLSGDSAPSRKTGQDVAGTLSARTQGGGGLGTDFECQGGVIPLCYGGNNTSGPIEVATALNACHSASGRMDFESETFVAFDCKAGGNTGFAVSDMAGALRGEGHGGGNQAIVTHSLRADGFDASGDGTGRGTPLVAVAFAQNSRDEVRFMGGDGQVVGALAAEPGMKQQTFLAQRSQVRRITPLEAERLQGFPDGWTQVPYRGKPAADGPRYKAIGNSMAVPVMAWLGQRIALVDAIHYQSEGVSSAA